MAFDLIRRVQTLGRPRLLVVGDLILDRYVWGDAERISQEAPVPLLRADRREHRLGGAASVATMLAALGAEVRLAGGVGDDPEGAFVRRMLDEKGIDHGGVVPLDDRPTTLKERYIGRAQDRHPQQMIRVDYEVRAPIPAPAEATILDALARAIRDVDVVLISDYDKGVCTPSLLRAAIDACRAAGVKVVADPIRSSDYARYRGVHCMTPNRLEAQLATGMTIQRPEDALPLGRRLVEQLGMESVLVTLDRDGMALVRGDGRAELLPTRPRQVYDITGAGDMVLSVVGLCLAAGADYDEAAALGNVAGGLEVEKIGVALLSREEILRDLLEHQHGGAGKVFDRTALLAEVWRMPPVGRREGRLHQRLLRHPPRRPRPLAPRGRGPGRLPDRRAQFRRECPPAQGAGPPAERRGCPCRAARGTRRRRCRDGLRRGHAAGPDRVDPSRCPGQGRRLSARSGRGRLCEVVEAAGGRLVLIPLVEGYSTTRLLQRAAEPKTVTLHPAQAGPPAPAVLTHPARSPASPPSSSPGAG